MQRNDYDELAISVYKQGYHYPTIILLQGEEHDVMVMKNENDEKIYLTQQEAKGMIKNYVHDNKGARYGIIIFEEKTSNLLKNHQVFGMSQNARRSVNTLLRITYYRDAGSYSTRTLRVR